jgi:parallel beta-helix repeat protein
MGKTSKTSVVAVLVLFSLISLMVLPSSTVKAQSRTIIVPTDYATIQTAIDNAYNGDTVFVKKGYYPETLVVNKSISIIGEDRNLTLIDGQQKLSQVVLIVAANVTFENFTLGNSGFEPPHNSGWYQSNGEGDGIRLYNGYPYEQEFVNIINNTIVQCPYYGIDISGGSKNNLITGNTIIGEFSGNGPHYSVFGLGSGIIVECSNSMIAYNSFVNTTVGICLYSESYREINTLIENKEQNSSIVYSPFPTATPAAIPSPTVPEFSWLAIVPLLLLIFGIIVIIRHRKSGSNGEIHF